MDGSSKGKNRRHFCRRFFVCAPCFFYIQGRILNIMANTFQKEKPKQKKEKGIPVHVAQASVTGLSIQSPGPVPGKYSPGHCP